MTNLWGDVAGWQIDGPAWPAKHGERQYTNRWVRFKNEDVGRFYRDYLKDDVRKEQDLLLGRWEPKRRFDNNSHIMPSMVQLRSLLIGETPEELARIATPDRFGGPASGVIGSCISVLRASRPIRYERLIPAGEPTPFVAGLEREIAGPNVYLAQSVQTRIEDKKAKTSQPLWPRIAWFGWQTPTGARWNFGQVIPAAPGAASAAPAALQRIRLSWNAEVVAYQ
ncbi:MAG: hypothetical protein NTX50_05390 [Candidatus Sumerlaeota bacterium]|nr:hypothetical protein [Candidatus Sumerlaeota bacterium]